MAREIEREPAVSENPRLEAVGVGTAITSTPRGASSAAARSISSPASGRCSSECQNTIAAQAALQILEPDGADVRASGVAFETEGLASASDQRVEQGSVACANVENGAGRRDSIETPGQTAARAPQDRVAETREATGRRPVPVAVGRAQLGLGRPRIRVGDAAASRSGLVPPRRSAVGTQRATAPRALARSGGVIYAG